MREIYFPLESKSEKEIERETFVFAEFENETKGSTFDLIRIDFLFDLFPFEKIELSLERIVDSKEIQLFQYSLTSLPKIF